MGQGRGVRLGPATLPARRHQSGTLHSLAQILDGKLDPVVQALAEDEKVRLLTTL